MYCTMCLKEIPDESHFCCYCGKEIHTKQICPHCDTKLPIDASFCCSCGFKLEPNSSDSITHPDSTIEYTDSELSYYFPTISNYYTYNNIPDDLKKYCDILITPDDVYPTVFDINTVNLIKNYYNNGYKKILLITPTFLNSNADSQFKVTLNDFDIDVVIFSEGIFTISANLFTNNASLQAIWFPNSLTCIDNYAFANCINLKHIDMQDNVVIIKKGAFQNCTNLLPFKLSQNLYFIDDYSFNYCNTFNLTQKDFPAKFIGEYCFQGTAITALTFSNPLHLGIGAFAACSQLTEVNFNFDEILDVPTSIFAECENLNAINYTRFNNLGSSNYGYVFQNNNNTIIFNCAGAGQIDTINAHAISNAFYAVNLCSTSCIFADIILTNAFCECTFNELIIAQSFFKEHTHVIAQQAFNMCTFKKLTIYANTIETNAFVDCSFDVLNIYTNNIAKNAFSNCNVTLLRINDVRLSDDSTNSYFFNDSI